MDIYRFINSRDIRAYLQEIEYKFSTVEAAYLVDRSCFHSLNEKFAAFREIIDAMPDCAWSRQNMHFESFHAFLDEFIALKQRQIALFYEGSGFVYQYYYYTNWPCKNSDRRDGEDVFADLDSSLAAAFADGSEAESLRVVVHKLPLLHASDVLGGDKPYKSTMEFNADGDVMDVYVYGFPEDDHDLDVLLFFDKICLSFPTPFHCGDIVASLREPERPLVLKSIRLWDKEKRIEEGFSPDGKTVKLAETFLSHVLEWGDASEMLYHIYRWDQDDGLYFDDDLPNSYLSLEKFRKPLEGDFKLLLPAAKALREAPDMDLEEICNPFYRHQRTLESQYSEMAL